MSILSVTEIIRPYISNLQVNYARQYREDGKAFVGVFVKYKSIRMVCAFCCQQFERDICHYEPDEKIISFVEKQGLDDTDSKLLARTLKMIKLITNA